VLLQLRDDLPGVSFGGTWCLPGGGVEKGEKPKEAAIREFAEETGYRLKNPQLLLTDRYDLPDRPKVHIYWEQYSKGQAIKCLEGSKMEFKSLEQIMALPVCLGHGEYIQKALENANLN